MRKKISMLLIGTMLASSFTIGASAEEGTPNEEYSGTIQVWSWTNDPEYQIAAFEKAYPNVKVEFTQIGTDYDTKMQTIVDNETDGPDVFYSDVKNVKSYIESDAWENLSADPYDADTSDIVPHSA